MWANIWFSKKNFKIKTFFNTKKTMVIFSKAEMFDMYIGLL